MKESDLWDLLPPERPLPAHRRRDIKEALMAQIDHDLEPGRGHGHDVDHDIDPDLDLGRAGAGSGAGRRSSRRPGPLRIAAVAAAAVAVVAGGVVLAGRTGSPTGPAEPEVVSVETALASSSAALAESGRIDCELRYGTEGEGSTGVLSYAFSGDDRSALFHLDGEPDDLESRVVDGETYTYMAVGPDDPTPRWYHWTDDLYDQPDNPSTPRPMLDPATFLDELAAAGPFEEVGEESLDGAPARRLRATHPEAIEDLGHMVRFVPGTVDTLDVWVGDDGFVHRIDVAFGGPDGAAGLKGTASITFDDYGAPVTIEVPVGAQDASMSILGQDV